MNIFIIILDLLLVGSLVFNATVTLIANRKERKLLLDYTKNNKRVRDFAEYYNKLSLTEKIVCGALIKHSLVKDVV